MTARAARRGALLATTAACVSVAATARAQDAAPATPATSAASATAAPRAVGLDASLGARLFARHLSYVDDIFGTLATQDLAPSVALTAAAQWYPAAAFTDGPAAHFGLVAGVDHGVFVASRPGPRGGVGTGDAGPYPTRSAGFHLGVRARAPLGASEAGFVVAYGGQDFALGTAGAGAQPPALPAVAYRFVRAAADAIVALGPRLALRADAAYLFVFDAGEFGRAPYFPRAAVGAVDASLALAVRVADGLEARLGGEVRHYFTALNPEPGDRHVAGGSVDRYVAATLALAYRR